MLAQNSRHIGNQYYFLCRAAERGEKEILSVKKHSNLPAYQKPSSFFPTQKKPSASEKLHPCPVILLFSRMSFEKDFLFYDPLDVRAESQ